MNGQVGGSLRGSTDFFVIVVRLLLHVVVVIVSASAVSHRTIGRTVASAQCDTESQRSGTARQFVSGNKREIIVNDNR